METRYLKTLVEVFEKGSFSKAAESLHITQSAVSQRVKFLEEQYGYQLVDRSGTVLEPTPAGLLVLTKSREILEKERQLTEGLQRLNGEKRLSLCCTPTFGMAYLPQVLSDFIRGRSDINDLKFVFLQPEESLRGLRSEDFDIAVLEHCVDQSFEGYERFPLPDDELLFVLSPNSGLELTDGFATLEELFRFRLFARRDGCSSKEMLRANLLKKGAAFDDFDGMVVSDDLHFTINSVLNGGGVAYVSSAIVNTYLKSGQMIGVRVKGFVHARGRCVAVLPHRREDPLLAELLQCIFRVASPHWCPQLVTANA